MTTSPPSTLPGSYYYDVNVYEREKIINFIHVIRLEDRPTCESVQKGPHSRGYGRGHLVVGGERSYASEHAVLDFQQKIVTALDLHTEKD